MNRRKEPRYRVRDNVFAIDSHESQRLGEVIDISRSGVSFRYIEGPNSFKPTTEINLFSSRHSLLLNHFPFETVADFPLQGHPSSAIIMRRLSGRFLSLTAQQQDALDDFIDLHAMEPQ